MARTQTERAVVDLVINGQSAKTTLKEVSLEVTRTRSALNKMKETDAGYKDKLRDMHALVDAQRQMTARINDTSTAWGRFKKEAGTVMTGVIGGNIATAGLQFLAGLIPDTIQKTLKLKDAFADIAKATNLSEQEVQKLNKALKGIDTRTTNQELRDIAVAGGQLGVPNQQLVDFVENVDHAVVALGDEFTGGVDQVAKEIGGIAKLFDETRSMEIGPAINNIGSALNELGAAGSATSPVVAEFTTRMGQLGDLAPKLSETLGLGAALQELGLTAEIAASGLSGLMLTAANKSDLFAQHLGMSKQAVEDLINTSPNQFLMTLAKSFENLTPVQVAQRLKELKVESQESIKVMSLLADQTDFVAKKQALAAKAMAEGTSLTNEFSKKNHQLARDLKALNEWFNSLLTSPALQSFLVSAVHNAVEFTKVLPQLGSWLEKNREYFYLLVTATVAYYGATIKATLSTIANTTAELARKAAYEISFRWLILSEAASKAYALATGVLTGQITLQTAAVTIARAAWASLSAVMLANPIGVVVVALTALAYAVKQYSDNTAAALKIEQTKVRLQRDMQILTELQTRSLNKLTDQLQDYNQMSQEERANYVRNVAMAKLDLESRLARMKAREKELEMLALEPSLWQKLWAMIKSGGNAALVPQGLMEQGLANAQAIREQFATNIDGYQEDLNRYDSILRQIRQYETPANPVGTGTMNTITDPELSKKKRDAKLKDAQNDAIALEKMLAESRKRISKNNETEYEKDVADFADYYTEMYILAGNNQAKIEEIGRLSTLEFFGVIDKKRTEKEKLESAKRLKEERDAAEAIIRAKQQQELDRIQGQSQGGKLPEDAARMAELQAENAYLLAKKAIYDKYYADVRALEIQSADKKEELTKEQAKSEAEIQAGLTKTIGQQLDTRLQHAEDVDQKMAMSQLARKQAIQSILSETLQLMQVNWTEQIQGIKDFWSQATIMQKAAFVASKAYSAAEATVAYYRTLMNIWATSGSPWAAVGFTALATATYGTVLAKIASANYSAPAFADGGFTGTGDGPGGFVDGPTLFTMGQRRFVAGEAGREFVVSNTALQNPVVANFARLTDVAQRTGNYGLLASGISSTGNPAGPGLSANAGGSGGMSAEVGMAILRELQMNRTTMEGYANRDIMLNYRLVEQYKDNLQQIRTTTGL